MTAVATQSPLQYLKIYLEARQEAFAQLLPRGAASAQKFVKGLFYAICSDQTGKLQRCTPQSLFLASLQAADLGLQPSTPQGHCYLVPYAGQATFQLGYKGALHLVYETGKVKEGGVEARVVYEGDEFEMEYGLTPRLRHVPRVGDAGKKVGAYVVFRFTDGGETFEFMNASEITAIRNRGPSKNSPAWRDNEGEMFKKVVIKRKCKTLHILTDRAARILGYDERAEAGAVPDLSVITEGNKEAADAAADLEPITIEATAESELAPPPKAAERIKSKVRGAAAASAAAVAPEPPKATSPWARIQALGEKHGVGGEALLEAVKRATGKESPKDLVEEDVRAVEEELQAGEIPDTPPAKG